MIHIGLGEKDKKTLDVPYNSIYCVVLAIWSTIMIEMWKRKENEIAHIWHMKDYKGNDAERPDFKADYVIDPQTKMVKKRSYTNSYIRRIFIEFPTILISIACVVGCFVGFRYFEEKHADSRSSMGASLINATIIIVLGVIYRMIVVKLADWENHRYQEEWENSLITKNYAFQFVNCYIALFSIAFADYDFNKMAENLAVILVAKQIALNLFEVIFPMLKTKYNRYKLNKKFREGFVGMPTNEEDLKIQLFAENQLILGMESNVLVMKYSELVIQFGYVVLFAPAFPLAALFCILCNLIEIKGNMNQMAYYSKRFSA